MTDSKKPIKIKITPEQLLEQVSKGFQTVNKNLFNMGLELAAVKGFKQTEPQNNTPSSQGDFLLMGNVASLLDESSRDQFMNELSILMQKYKVFDVKVTLIKKF